MTCMMRQVDPFASKACGILSLKVETAHQLAAFDQLFAFSALRQPQPLARQPPPFGASMTAESGPQP